MVIYYFHDYFNFYSYYFYAYHNGHYFYSNASLWSLILSLLFSFRALFYDVNPKLPVINMFCHNPIFYTYIFLHLCFLKSMHSFPCCCYFCSSQASHIWQIFFQSNLNLGRETHILKRKFKSCCVLLNLVGRFSKTNHSSRFWSCTTHIMATGWDVHINMSF